MKALRAQSSQASSPASPSEAAERKAVQSEMEQVKALRVLSTKTAQNLASLEKAKHEEIQRKLGWVKVEATEEHLQTMSAPASTCQEAPATQAAAKEPPATEPPATEPSATEPSAMRPPAQAPPAKAPEAEPYSRRAAAGVLSRLRSNPTRLNGLPDDLRNAVLCEEKKPQLITMLVESKGDVDAMQVIFRQTLEKTGKKKDLNSLESLTETEVRTRYGAQADSVMAEKEKNGLVEADPNLPGAKMYLVAKRSRRMCDCWMPVYKMSVAFLWTGRPPK